jgi:thiol-disulfide isomerase/thioredoxin
VLTLFRRSVPPARYELVTRDGCHLCDEMAAVLDAVLPAFHLSYVARDVDVEPELRERFSDVVPVLLRDGRPVAKVRVDRAALSRIVRGRRG